MPFLTRRLPIWLAAIAVALFFAYYKQQPATPHFHNVDITGSAEFGRDFALSDHTGKLRTLADFKGKVVLMFFGFTHCPDICPTTMSEMRQVMDTLGDEAKRVQVLFVTVDPERDTQALLAQYVPAFHPSFLGMRPADSQALEKIAKDFKIFYSKVPGTTPDSYTMDHTAASYVFDPEGKLRLFVRHGQGTQPLVDDIRQLLK